MCHFYDAQYVHPLLAFLIGLLHYIVNMFFFVFKQKTAYEIVM